MMSFTKLLLLLLVITAVSINCADCFECPNDVDCCEYNCVYEALKSGFLNSSDYPEFVNVFQLNKNGMPNIVLIDATVNWTNGCTNDTVSQLTKKYFWGESTVMVVFGPQLKLFHPLLLLDPLMLVINLIMATVLPKTQIKEDILRPWVIYGNASLNIVMTQSVCLPFDPTEGQLNNKETVDRALKKLLSQSLAIITNDGRNIGDIDNENSNALFGLFVFLHIIVIFFVLLVVLKFVCYEEKGEANNGAGNGGANNGAGNGGANNGAGNGGANNGAGNGGANNGAGNGGANNGAGNNRDSQEMDDVSVGSGNAASDGGANTSTASIGGVFDHMTYRYSYVFASILQFQYVTIFIIILDLAIVAGDKVHVLPPSIFHIPNKHDLQYGLLISQIIVNSACAMISTISLICSACFSCCHMNRCANKLKSYPKKANTVVFFAVYSSLLVPTFTHLISFPLETTGLVIMYITVETCLVTSVIYCMIKGLCKKNKKGCYRCPSSEAPTPHAQQLQSEEMGPLLSNSSPQQETGTSQKASIVSGIHIFLMMTCVFLIIVTSVLIYIAALFSTVNVVVITTTTIGIIGSVFLIGLHPMALDFWQVIKEMYQNIRGENPTDKGSFTADSSLDQLPPATGHAEAHHSNNSE